MPLPRTVAIIGGGPIGMEAALYGACAGFDVQLYERGDVAHYVRKWGHIGVFTDWSRNRSPLAVKLLQGSDLPPGDTTSTGHELGEYVQRLAALPQLAGRVATYTTVVSLTRHGCLKSDFPDDPWRRAIHPFRMLLRGPQGSDVATADAVIDASGVYGQPNWVGSGGGPCPGEQKYENHIVYQLPDVAGRDRERYANRHTMVVGSGHSAAQTLLAISHLMPQYPETRLTWVVRRDVPPHGYPYTLIPNETSPHRDEMHRGANELTNHPNLDFRPRSVVESIGTGEQLMVLISGPGSLQWVHCDSLVAHTGFHPDPLLWSELQMTQHPVTGGPFGLAEAIVAQNRRRGVGLSTGYAETAPQPDGEVPERWRRPLEDPALVRLSEPNFFVVGIKSFGRDAGFLMQHGFRQVREVWRLISGDPELDLYDGALND